MDFVEMAENLGLEEKEFLEFVELFIETSESDLKDLNKALLSGDSTQAVEAAHSIKGAASNLGFMTLSETAQDIEMRARENRLEGTIKAVGSMNDELNVITETYRSKTVGS